MDKNMRDLLQKHVRNENGDKLTKVTIGLMNTVKLPRPVKDDRGTNVVPNMMNPKCYWYINMLSINHRGKLN